MHHDSIVNDYNSASNHHLGGHEGQGIDLGSAFGLDAHGGHNFIAHFLGTDSCNSSDNFADSPHGHGHTLAGSNHPGHVTSPDSFNGLTIGTFFSGFKFSRNLLFVGIFGLMAFWLCLIHWVRGNEPSINQALGMGTGAAPAQPISSVTDQRLLDGTRHAMPIPTPMTQARQATLGVTQQYYQAPNLVPESRAQIYAAPGAAIGQSYSQPANSSPIVYPQAVNLNQPVRIKTIVTR